MIRPGTSLHDLDTPCLLVDLTKMEANIREWQHDIASHGVKLRPHVKTHKSPAIAAMQLAAGASGITVAKVSEAEVFAEHGCKDIFIAYPVIGANKWKRVAALARTCKVAVGVDSVVGARGLGEAATAAGTTVGVRVEIDLGMNRSGVLPQDAAALCKQVLEMKGITLEGIFTFRSVFFPGAANRTADETARDEGECMVKLANQLRATGIPIREVSLGSTPTARQAARVAGVTEVRPGTYVFGDWAMSSRGAIPRERVALSILCTVVSRPAVDKATVDGGSKTFCGDMNPAKLGVPGYALAVGVDAHVEAMSEEHGVVRLGVGVQPRIGDRMAFHPLHVCTAVNLANELVGVRGDKVEAVFPILARGMNV